MKKVDGKQGRRKHLKLGDTALRGHFFVEKKGAFSKIKRALVCLLQKLGGTCPQGPLLPMSMVENSTKYFL